MKKIYFIFPIVGCVLFLALYLNFRSHNTEVEQAKKLALQKEKEAKLSREVAERKIAYDAAILLAEKRKQEKEAKEEKDRLEREARQALLDERERVFKEQDKQAAQVRKLNEDLKAEQSEIQKIKEVIASHKAEIDAQQTHVTLAKQNEKNFEQILAKIDAVDKAAAQAAAQAAAAAKKS
jgi:hypothetical protein